ncbi:MAG: hypothetical protein ACRD6X_15325, partial [Pyrinomonadaceae bacterium]
MRLFYMDTLEIKQEESLGITGNLSQRGSALVIALFILALIGTFVALALTRSSSEAAAVGNEAAEGRAVYAAQGSLEVMTRNFNKLFEVELNPGPADITTVQTAIVPGLDNRVGGQYNFFQEVIQTDENRPTSEKTINLTQGPFAGLVSIQDNWRLRTTATDPGGTQVQLTRNILNNRIPIFQFGIFYDDDLEFHPGPRFDFGGRVHSNGSLFLMGGAAGVNFSSKVTAVQHVFTDTGKNGTYTWVDNVTINNASSMPIRLRVNEGSVLANTVNGPPVTGAPLPTAYNNAGWAASETRFDGNLLAYTSALNLPLKLNSNNTGQNLGLIEIIKRGKSPGDLWNDGTGTVAAPNIIPVVAGNGDDKITQSERYYNKTGIRISLADSKAKLPGCVTPANAAVPGRCGIRLDGDNLGVLEGAVVGARGYRPKAMADGYQATEINGERFWLNIPGREMWIKVETVIYNKTTQVYDAVDITEEMLSLGVTEEARRITAVAPANNFQITDPNYDNGVAGSLRNDSRSVIKLQRFMFSDPAGAGTAVPVTSNVMQSATFGGRIRNYVVSATRPSLPIGSTCASGGTAPANNGTFPNGIVGGDNP